jgi:hypothetical protein
MKFRATFLFFWCWGANPGPQLLNYTIQPSALRATLPLRNMEASEDEAIVNMRQN